MRHCLITMILLTSILWSCTDDESGVPGGEDNSFDRREMLIHWADNIIIPAYRHYHHTLLTLNAEIDSFGTVPDTASLQQVRAGWEAAYIAWQQVSLFEIGRAERLSMRSFTNTYPADPQKIENATAEENATLSLPSTRTQQGFPAIDYLINNGTDEGIVKQYTESTLRQKYLTTLAEKLLGMATEVLNDWEGTYRDTFVSNAGSDAGNSVNKLANDFLFYYEKNLRAGKVGIPAGRFSNNTLPNQVESLYRPQLSKTLLLTALTAVSDFFNGVPFGEGSEGIGFDDYINYLETTDADGSLSTMINQQFGSAKTALGMLRDNLKLQIETDNTKMLELYDELQKNVILIKTDMFSKLSIRVDFTDADGD